MYLDFLDPVVENSIMQGQVCATYLAVPKTADRLHLLGTVLSISDIDGAARWRAQILIADTDYDRRLGAQDETHLLLHMY